MMNIRKLITYLSVLGLLFSVASVIYGIKGPCYKTEPLVSSFTFANGEPQLFEFKVGRAETYLIEIYFKNVFPEEEMDSILGDYVKRGEGALINIAWDIKENDNIIAHGSNVEYGYSHIFGMDHSGLTIGDFNAVPRVKYILSLYVRSIYPRWDQAKPYVEVGLHPAQLEYLLGYQILGSLLFIIFFIILCSVAIFSIIKYIKNKHSSSVLESQGNHKI